MSPLRKRTVTQPTIITLSGKARHGKDTAAAMLEERLKARQKRVLNIRYADYLKFIVAAYFGGSYERTPENRSLWQHFGTETVRARDENFWVDTVIRLVRVLADRFDYVLIPDVRFPNEISRWRDEGFSVRTIRVVRTGFENDLTPQQRMHASETALDGFSFDRELHAATLDELSSEIDKVLLFVL